MEQILQLLAIAIVVVAVGAGILKAIWGGMTSDEGKSGGTGPKFQAECPNCGRDVTIADEKMVGLWKDCPSCRKQFRVEQLRRVSTERSSSRSDDQDFIIMTVISMCVGLVAAIAIALSGHGSALLITDVAVAAGFVFHVTGLGKMDAQHTAYLKLARSIYLLGWMIAIAIAFLFYRTPAAKVAATVLIFILIGAGGTGFSGRQWTRSACYMLFWSWVVFFGVRVYNPQLLARPAENPQVANGEQQPHNDEEQVVAPVVMVAGEPITPALQHQGDVRHAAFSPDGRRVVTASEDKTAQVWDATTGQPVTPVLRHQYGLRWAAFSPDGLLIATASGQFAKGEARVWNAETGEVVGTPLEHKGLVNHVAFSPDGRYIITASEDRTARVWDAKTAQAVAPPLPHENNVYFGAFSPDGRWIVTAGQDTVRVWDATTGQPHSRPLNVSVNHATFSPNGDRVMTAGETAQVWDVRTSERVTAEMKSDDAIQHAEFSRDGRRIVTTSGYDGRGEARIWDAATGRPLTSPMKHKGNVPHATFSPDGRFVVTASYDKTAIVWNVETGEASIPPLQHREGVYYAEFSPDGERVVTASHDKTARVWYVAQKKPADENKSDPKPVQHAKAETQQEKDEAELELLLINELAKSSDAIPKARELALRLLEPLSVAEAERKVRGNVSPRAQMLPLLPRLGLTIDESRRHVRRLLQDGDERVALAAPDALLKLSQDQADVSEDVIAMFKVWNSGSVEIREAVRKATIELALRDQPHLFAALKSDDAAIRIHAGEVLGLLGNMQKLDLSLALKYRDDERAAPVVLRAVFRLKPFPKEGLPLLVTGLRGNPELASAAGEILKKSSTDDLKPLVPGLTKLVDHADLNVHRAALDGLASVGAHAIPFLAERVRKAKPDKDRDFIYATTFERACALVKSSDKEIVSFLVESVADDDESKASQAVANSSVGALIRLTKDDPSAVSASKLVASFTGKSDVSLGAGRIQRILGSMGEAAVKELIRGTESKDESVCVWSLRTVPLIPEFFSNGLVIDQANEFAKLAFESRSERVRQAGYSLLHQFPSFRLPQSTLPIIKKYVNSKDIQKQSWAVALSGKVATGSTKSPKVKPKK